MSEMVELQLRKPGSGPTPSAEGDSSSWRALVQNLLRVLCDVEPESASTESDELRAKLHVAERIVTLQDRVKRLEGILPTCMYCKKIRDENQTWVSIEQYVTKRSDAEFSHGICPDCFTKASAQLGDIDH